MTPENKVTFIGIGALILCFMFPPLFIVFAFLLWFGTRK